MEYEIKNIGAGSELFLRGHLTFEGNEAFREVMNKLAARRDLMIDASGLEFIDSAGLGMLLLLHETLSGTGAKLSLRRAQGQVRRLLVASHFDRLVAMVA